MQTFLSIFFLFHSIFLQKIKMFQAKQNFHKIMFKPKKRKSLNNLCQSTSFFSTTQSLFTSKKNSIKLQSFQLNKPDFCKTVKNSTKWGKWMGPESKQSFIKLMLRPQTSKGFRKQPGQNIVLSNIENERIPESNIKSVINSKRRNKQIDKQQWNQNNKEYYQSKKNQSQDRTHQQFEDTNIVINRRTCQFIKKRASVYKEKFETNLDDEFLQLFAD